MSSNNSKTKLTILILSSNIDIVWRPKWLPEEFEIFETSNSIVAIKKGFKDILLPDIKTNFKNIDFSTVKYFKGRGVYFSYKPSNSPRRFVIKRYMRGGLIRFLMKDMFLDGSRPFQELYISNLAREKGINTPEIVAILVEHRIFFRFTSIMEEISPLEDLYNYLKTNTAKKFLLKKLALELRHLHSLGIYHPDLNLKNILVSDSGVPEARSIFFIDFDKATIWTELSEKQKLTNVKRLNRSVEKLSYGASEGDPVTDKEKLEFLARFLNDKAKVKKWANYCKKGLWLHKFFWAITRIKNGKNTYYRK